MNQAQTPAAQQKAVEMILMRQLSSYLAMPIFLVDLNGNLLYYNEPAERLLGHRFDETGELTAEEWSTVWEARGEEGKPIPPEQLPLMVSLSTHKPAHRHMTIRGLDGISRNIEVTAIPLEGQGGRHLGAVAIFWESD